MFLKQKKLTHTNDHHCFVFIIVHNLSNIKCVLKIDFNLQIGCKDPASNADGSQSQQLEMCGMQFQFRFYEKQHFQSWFSLKMYKNYYFSVTTHPCHQYYSPVNKTSRPWPCPRGHFMKSLALALDVKSLTIGCCTITLLFVIFQWNRIREFEQKTFAFTLLLIWIKFKLYFNIIINTHSR